MSASQYISKHSGSSTDPPIPTDCESRNPSADHLDKCLPQHLNVDVIEMPTSGCYLSPIKNDVVNLKREKGVKNSDKSESSSTSASDKSFNKCTTFSSLDEPRSSLDGLSGGKKQREDGGTAAVPEVNQSAQSPNQFHSQSALLPTPLKLVSSMKGSREKQGISPKKLSVTWAPDVYDPIPTSVSHVPNNNQHRRRDGKKYRKNKNKKGDGKSEASRSNDKKQSKKKKKKKCKPMHDDNGVVGVSEPQASSLDFDVASLNPSCAKSFLMTSVNKMHFPVGEAT